MAGTSLFALIDDIAALLDDVSVMTKMAAQKTAGVLGDDLALNAQQVAGVRADRELPVVWAVAKGSMLNKVILVPAALMISYFLPWLVVPLLMVGGAYLCFEGVEKLAHAFLPDSHHANAEHQRHLEALADDTVDLVAFERDKIRGAIRTDFILSAEIIVIALGTAAAATLLQQFLVLAGIALAMTIFVYGLVAGIVKLDDVGLYLVRSRRNHFLMSVGQGLLWLAPAIMKFLSVAGVVAMFMVGGGILVHGIDPIASVIHAIETTLRSIPFFGGVLAFIVPAFLNVLFGALVGFAVLSVYWFVRKLMRCK